LINEYLNQILARVRDELATKFETTEEWLRELDPGRTGNIPIENFKDLIKSICPDLVEQEIITVCRRYDLDGNGQVSLYIYLVFGY
jgi:Ca2+-binding EF-hand superfamily protein